ncbi:MAG: phosphoribosylglycinamide formyltransferase [Bacteroidetes bacterium]|nr:phosphoribosylglycinamide formyltransferase [Bacteroidota bacterium]
MSAQAVRIAIFASGSGTNAGKIMEHFSGHKRIEVALVLSNRKDAYVLKRASDHGVETRVFNREEFQGDALSILLKEKGITHLVLAGFLWLMPSQLIKQFDNHIINIHPSLLPDFGGKGMYGMNVHQAVKHSGKNETGITIHLVNEQYDKGKILYQAKCKVLENDTAEQIAEKVHELEYQYFSEIIESWCLNEKIS